MGAVEKGVLLILYIMSIMLRALHKSLLCHQPDRQIHMLSGCQNASIQNMVTEIHNIASRLIIYDS